MDETVFPSISRCRILEGSVGMDVAAFYAVSVRQHVFNPHILLGGAEDGMEILLRGLWVQP